MQRILAIQRKVNIDIDEILSHKKRCNATEERKKRVLTTLK